MGLAFLDALERAGHADRFARLEHQGVPVGGIGERIHVHVRVADDGGVGEVQVACLVPCAVAGGRVGLGGVRDDERDADVVGVHLQRLLRVVAVRLLLAFLLEGRGIDLLQVDARGHVRGLGDDLVGFARLAVDGLGPRVGHLVGHGDALALEVEHPAGLVLVVGAHQVEVGLGRVGRDLAVVVGVHGEQVAAELRGVEAAARDLLAPGREHLAVPVQITRGVDGPVAQVLVVLGGQLVRAAPVRDGLVGAVRGQDAGIQSVEERVVQIHALAVDAVAADLHGHVLGRVDLLQRVGDGVGLVAPVVRDLRGGVLHRVAVLDLGDGHRHDHLVGVAQQRLVDARVLQRVVILVGFLAVRLQVVGLRVAGNGLAGRGDLGVHGFGEGVEHPVLVLDVELAGAVPAGLVKDLHVLRVEGQVLLVVVVRHAQAPYLVGGVGEPGGVDVDAVVHLVAQQRGLAVDADGRVLLRVLLGGLDDRRLVLDLVGRGDAVVDGQRGLVADGLVGGRVLVHLGLEAQQHARVGAGLPVGGNPVLGERGLERVVGFVPLHLVGALRDDAAGSQVGDLQGLLVRGGVLGIGVAQLDGGHRICLVRRDLRVHAHGVFHGLAGEHGLGVDAGLVAALGGFGDDLLVDRGNGHADLRRVGVHRAAADRLAALVVEVVALRVRARVELVALRLAVGFEQLHGVEVHVERDHDADLLRGLQVLLRGLVGVLRADRDLGALGGDVELVGHVPAGLVQVVDAGVGLVGGVLLVDLDVGGVLQVEDAIDVGEVVGPRDLGHAAQSCGQGAGDDRRHLVAETVVLVVAAHLVALGRIDGQLPLAADLHGPRLVGVGCPHEHRRLVGRSGLVVPLLVRLVGQLDLLALGGTLFDGARQVEPDLARAVPEHRLRDVRSLRGGGRGPGLPVDHDIELVGLVLAVDEHLAGLPVDPLVRTGQIIGDGIGCQRVEQVRGDAAVDDHAHLVAHEERLLIDALLVGPTLVLGHESAGLVQHPHLVRGRRDLAHAVAVAGLAVGQAAGAVVSVPARHGTVVDLVVAAGGFGRLWHVQRVEAGMRGGGVRLDHALAIDGIVDGNVRRHDVAVRVGHGHLAHVVLLGAADHHVPGVDRVVDPELAGGVGMRLDVRRVQRTGRDGVVAVPHRVAGPVGQPFLGRGGGLLAGLLAVVLSLVGDRLGHVALLRHVNVPPALARRPRLPRGVHVLEGRAHCGAALVGCGEPLRHRLLGAVNATPVQGRGAVHVLGLRPVAGQGDRVRSILGVARLARHLRSLRADAQMI